MSDLSSAENADPGVALALGSAFLGMYAHGGFLCGLNKAGVFPGHIAGASAGAMAAGFYASGLRDSELEGAILSSKLKRAYPDFSILLRVAPMFFIGRLSGLMHGKRVVRHLEKHLSVSAIEDTQEVKLKIAVTDLRGFTAGFLDRGPLAKSMMASCSVPLLFTEQRIGETLYHDGGILHELPLEPYLRDPAIHTIIVHKVIYPPRIKGRHLGISAAFSHSHQIMNDALYAYRRAEAERNGKRVIFIGTSHPHPGLFQSKSAKKSFFEAGLSSGLSICSELPL
jgi:predicted acylesterase/phospholipase RssA